VCRDRGFGECSRWRFGERRILKILVWLTIIRAFLLLLLTGALAYSGLRIWRNNVGPRRRRTGVDFRPSVGFSWQDGFNSVALLLANKSSTDVWAEEVEIALTGLSANQQTSEASCHEVRKILQSVSPHDLLPISLMETIYTAAGKPQRDYSCVLSSVVRYRVGEEWFEEPMHSYKLKMIGLTVSGIRRERKFAYDFKSHDKPNDLSGASTNLK